MAAPSMPASVAEEQPRRTREPSLYTNLFLVLTAVFAVWSGLLIVLTALAIAEPFQSPFPNPTKLFLKAAGAVTVGLIAVEQSYTMGAAMGYLPRFNLRMKHLMRTHRYLGRIGIVLAVVVAWFCMIDIGAPLDTGLRPAVHGFFGSTAFIALAIKFALIRFRPALAYDVAPWLGRYAALAFVVVALSSAFFYYTGQL
jgi:hypothetical protein